MNFLFKSLTRQSSNVCSLLKVAFLYSQSFLTSKLLIELPRARTNDSFCPVAVTSASEPFSIDLEGGWTSVGGLVVSDEEGVKEGETDDIDDDDEWESAEEDDIESMETD